MSNRRKLRRPIPTSFVSSRRAEASTRWNGEPCAARKVRVMVADSDFFPAYWARQYVDTVREAVEVTYNGQTFYLDNEDGSGWHKVTHGGGPGWPHRDLEISAVMGEATR